MKNIIYLSLTAFVLGFCSCSNETFEGNGQITNDQLKAVTPTIDSRTTMNGTSVLWSANDHIGVIAHDNTVYANNDYHLTNGANTQSADFEGSYTGIKVLAYYPYNKSTTYDGSTIKLTMPDNYTYNSQEPNSNNQAPMACKISADKQDNISFKNAGALIYITLNNIPEGYNKAVLTSEGNAAPNIAGDTEINFDADGNPTLTAAASASNSKSITISFTASSGSTQNLQFYFPIPVATYPELNISITKDGSEPKNIKSFTGSNGQGVKATRGTRLYTTVTIDKITGSVPTEVTNTSEATTALQSSTAVTINEIKDENSPTISLPKKDATAAQSPVSISIGKVSSASTITLKESTEGSGTAAKQVNLSLGEIASQTSLDVDLPNSTTTVSSNDGTAVTIDKITAKTAVNTLIIDKNVTVKELIIAGGNVKVYGVVENISRSNDNAEASTTVTSYGAADIKVVSGDNTDKFSFKSEWDGVSVVTPTNNKIYTAAQFASYQSKTVDQHVAADALAITMSAGAELFADIDLKNKDWQGIVLASGQTFDGNKKTISNLSMTKPVLYETGDRTHPACIGLFAAAYANSTIKGITLKGVRVGTEAKNVECKWTGSLVGYSQAKTYTDCKAEDVKLYCNTNLGYYSSYRVGGLIGFIAAGDPTLTSCTVNNATIVANFAYGGLVGSVMTASTTFTTCKTSNITLLLGDCRNEDLGTVSKFIGDVELAGGTRSITIGDSNSSDALTSDEKDALHFYMITKKDANNSVLTYTDGNQYIGRISKAQLTLTVNGSTLAQGTDYNKYEVAPYTPGSIPQYDKNGTTGWEK